MKYVIKIVYGILAIVFIGFLVYFVLFEPEKDYKKIVECVFRIVACILILTGIRKRRGRPNYRQYEKAYQYFINGAFADDKQSYRKLLEVAACYNFDDHAKAHRLLNQLEKACKNSKDYLAVYVFRAWVYQEQGKLNEAIATYEKFLQYDMTNSLVWSNLGLLYEQAQLSQPAYEAFANAIRFDPQNAKAHNNLANWYIHTGDMEQALRYALKALELNETLYQAMGAASIAYKALGDEEAAEKYCRLYGTYGGNEQNLRDYYVSML